MVAELVKDLVGRPWTDRNANERTLTIEDILIVAPYNAHVAVLVGKLPPGSRVGTVDKFQGQEAPVVIYSMATSSAAATCSARCRRRRTTSGASPRS